ncbi:TetR/AcrR family transcriptional regulator [Nitratifractor salsuginis]|uniref:Transcriptional regulator, TetR family n=1 Tax=Nitratifractor salsuginis (strain DSM 16511 / JCM 12458 / E9I37-1) TaxID=749222 RepID=E6WXT1_NITSE|nr:TetR/AcrR family transcriptional regulator [Nitratifractor salsuginis]ADV46338.1 transcriptional regulator, TetR family [Nitratifractor salsuginis DSM 16511]
MDKEKVSTKQRILESALKLFSTKGYKATTMRDIAAEVGVRQGAIYNHFKSKETILESLIADLTDSALVHLFDKDLDPKKGKQLLAKIATTFKLISFDPRNEALFRLMMQELFRNEKVRELYHEHFYQQNVKRLSTYLFQMMQEELIRSSDPLLLANEFFAPLFFYQMQVVLLKLDGKSTSAAVTMFEKHVDLFWDSVKLSNHTPTLF